MFKKLSLHLHKSHIDTRHGHNEPMNRDSLIDPNNSKPYIDMSTGYTQDTYIEPNTVKMTDIYPEHYYNQQSSNYDLSNYYQQNNKSDDLQLPPLTIDSSSSGTRTSAVYPSPVSIPSPITPGMTNEKLVQRIKVDETEALVHEGISFHEKGQLEKATQLFRIGAEKGNPIGMFLYGVSLRHGWGCKKSEHAAFQYLQKAAEHAVEDLANITNTVNTSASKGELIMAIYELGVSFRHGWGCKKNKESAVQFFKIAADLGDPDAQNDLGHCYYHGQGVKKDLYLAAKYYRKADKQGQGIMGNSWIWKPKYDSPPHK